MGRKNRDSGHFRPTPVQHIVLHDDKNNKKRFLIVIALIALALVAIAYGTFSYFDSGEGWTTISASSSAGIAESSEFTFQYCLGKTGEDSLVENKALTLIYTDTLKKVTRLFDADSSYEDIHNIYYINHHPNEVIRIEPELYQAFEKLEQYGNRDIYLAPIYEQYTTLFYCNGDEEAIFFDPYVSQDQREYFEEVLSIISKEDSIRVELLGNDRIQLVIDDAYLQYGQELGYTRWIDFYWMKNAFIVDALADTMIQKGYTHGNISSYDGFTRNMDQEEQMYVYPIYDRIENVIYHAGNMQYTGQMSFVWLRDFAMKEVDNRHYYKYRDGTTRTAYIDVKDGFCKNSVNSLLGYSKDQSCVDIMLSLSPVWIAAELSEDQILLLKEEGMDVIYGSDHAIVCTDSKVELVELYEKDNVAFSKKVLE